jgi:LPXTG-motif cell wall-anchored protein
VSDILVPFANNQGFDLDIGPGKVSFTASGVVPDFVQLSFSKVNVPNGETTTFGGFDLDFGGAAPGEVEVAIEEVRFDVALAGGGKLTEVRCTPTGNDVITTVDIVLPPPPGAPNANPDSAEVAPGESVNIAVLVNDEAAQLDRAALGEVTAPEIMDAPGEGTAEVEDDGTITYTADADTTATSDSFQYRICTDFGDVPTFGRSFVRGEQQPCDTTTVSIGILQPQGTTVAPPTTTEPTQGTSASSVSPTTDELPMTGSASTPLGAAGFGLALVGLGLVAVSRRHAATR